MDFGALDIIVIMLASDPTLFAAEGICYALLPGAAGFPVSS
jgi:hypothetical protein